MLRNKPEAGWRPSCGIEALRARASMLSGIRRFFEERGVLEVETPLLCRTSGTDPNLHPFIAGFRLPGHAEEIPLYLQTSPEFAMKRLLAAGSGSIYQICKAFRNEEAGRYHNPEFTLLEWYRVGFGLDRLIDEIEVLITALFDAQRALAPSQRMAYRSLFEQHTGLDPIGANVSAFAQFAHRQNMPEAEVLCGNDRNHWLDLLFSCYVQPHLGRGRIDFVYDYPACLPSLARTKPDDPSVVERVEIFMDGLELGNGFHELADAEEQERRFDADLAARRSNGLLEPPKDQLLLAALRQGLPDCSGVALGLDRLLMLLTHSERLSETISFTVV